MKKILALILAAVMLLSLCACGATTGTDDTTAADGETTTAADNSTSTEAIKIGMICLHDEDSTYDLNFINGLKEAAANLGLAEDQVVITRNIAESNDCYEAAADLVDEGCDIIFADSFGHEDFMIKAAKEFTDVQFCHATGTKAHTEGVANFHNAFAAIYEGRYTAGVAAGMKLNEMIEAGTITEDEALIGYVGAFTYAEVISGYTSFYLGAKSVCPSAKMNVQFTGSWYDEAAEKTTALSLISGGCVLISQHADSMGAPSACEEKNVPDVSYNGSTVESCPNTFIVSSRINWAPYFEYIYNCVKNGEAIDTDWTGTIATGSVVLSEVNEKAAAAGTVDAVNATIEKFKSGELKVYDVKNFTVEGKALDTYMADVDTDANYEKDTEALKTENGITYFAESEFRSAPYFDITVDGITLLNTNFG